MKLSEFIKRLKEKQEELDYDPTVVVYEPYSNMHERPIEYVTESDSDILIAPK